MNDISSVISGIGGAIGRYFGLVSFVPSLFLTSFTFLLIKSGAWGNGARPDWVRAGHSFSSLGNIALLILASVALGVITHPIQYALVQFFEGYWGVGRLARRARAARIMRYRRRVAYLEFGVGDEMERVLSKRRHLGKRDEIERLSVEDERARLRAGFPVEWERDEDQPDQDQCEIMPTRLGNVLRKYERLAGAPYGLDAVSVLPHIALLAPAQRIAYLNDQRQTLDLAVRMCATSLVAVLVAIAFLWRHGPWLLLALVPYGVAYISYRGAIVVAHEYGTAICVLVDLDRFALYSALHVRQPQSTGSERRMNDELMKMMRHNPDANVRYAKTPPPGPTDTQRNAN